MIHKQVNWGECYFDHFVHYLGNPVGREVFGQSEYSPAVQILAYDGVIDRCRIFCSLGVTHYFADLNGVGELFLPVDDGWKDTPYLLANTIFYMISQHMSIGWGISISGIDHLKPSFAKIFDKNAIYITEPYGVPDDFTRVTYNGEAGKVYLAMFISSAEHRFFVENGAEKFQDLLESKNVDPYDLRRTSCV